ncbi:VanZ family protein [Limnohabitans sp.]|uniref:VanZ family protein n=1 Tax=Limnohabitans sp. TaxID=1907725 RepID=UPI0039BC5041|nr:VanZ family protein [Comamonadaceae bacterium]
MTRRTSAAWPLFCIYAVLIVYASLYPFDHWRFQGVMSWSFLTASWPRYWTGFDVLSNVLGYAPMGFLLALSLRRMRPRWPAVVVATLLAASLSLALESLQMFLPVRVPSNVDMALNTAGAWVGAAVARGLVWVGLMDHWNRFRDRWFETEASGALALLAVWPLALLFPAAVPFGLGQVLERLEGTWIQLLQDTPWLESWPVREVEFQPLLPMTESVCVALGLLLPCLLAYGVVQRRPQRWVLAGFCLTGGLLASALSAALTYGPVHAWGWVSPEVMQGLAAALTLALALSWASPRLCWVLALAALVLQLSLLNTASADAYFPLTLQTWEQGRFIRFHGLIQWLGWSWPFALLVYLVRRLSMSPSAGRA